MRRGPVVTVNGRDVPEVLEDGRTILWDRPLDEVRTAAEPLGLNVILTADERGGDLMYGITVDHPARHPGDWSMTPFEIAIARDVRTVERKARAAIIAMAPQIAAKLAAASPEPPETRIAAGISGDGTVTALRVERDGTVRLSAEDIEAIAEAVVRLLRDDAGEIAVAALRASAGVEYRFLGHTDGCTPGVSHRAADGSGNCPCDCHSWHGGDD